MMGSVGLGQVKTSVGWVGSKDQNVGIGMGLKNGPRPTTSA